MNNFLTVVGMVGISKCGNIEVWEYRISNKEQGMSKFVE